MAECVGVHTGGCMGGYGNRPVFMNNGTGPMTPPLQSHFVSSWYEKIAGFQHFVDLFSRFSDILLH